MKKARLDQILHRLGYTSEEQIKTALIRQKERGGRLGSNLLEMKYITEQQLTQALSIQYDVAAFFPPPGGQSPPGEVLGMVPPELVRASLVIPINYDEKASTLTVVIANPEDTETLRSVARSSGCKRVSVSVAPESVIKRLIESWYPADGKHDRRRAGIELPDLFTDKAPGEPIAPDAETLEEEVGGNNVLMVSEAVFLKNFLVPIFEREGFTLTMFSKKEDVIGALATGSIDHVLVSSDMSETFDKWKADAPGGTDPPEMSIFSSVSSALLDNPVPYSVTVSSILRALRIAAESRSGSCEPPPPYDLISRDVHSLVSDLGLGRIACDGTRMASLLLVPDRPEPGIFADTQRTMEYARALGFPWDVAGAVEAVLNLFSGDLDPGDESIHDESVMTGAQAAAVVWYRYTTLRNDEQDEEKALSLIKSGLREIAGRIARSEIVESYIRLLEQAGSRHTTFRQIFIVGDVDSSADKFAGHIKHLGYRLVRIYDVEEAGRMSERLSPTAVLLDESCFTGDASKCRRIFSSEGSMPVFAVTSDSNPSHILDLFDAGFDEVFSPPFDLDIIAARISRMIDSRTSPVTKPHRPGVFGAELKAFSLIDLLQALHQGFKSVCIRLTGTGGEEARICMKDGRPVFADCGDLRGEEAIHRLISWGEEGRFVVEPAEDFPEPNISSSLESILMEGCRLLDESGA